VHSPTASAECADKRVSERTWKEIAMPIPIERQSPIERCLSGAETGLGIALAITPVTLWVAWTPSVFFAAVTVAAISAALLVLLDRHRRSAPEQARSTPRDACSQPVLPDGFVEEIHQLVPLTYHHSHSGPAHFRNAMQRLRKLLP
jgi:hypothetical protein